MTAADIMAADARLLRVLVTHLIPSLSIRSSRARSKFWDNRADFRRFTMSNSLPGSASSSAVESVIARINCAHVSGCSKTSACSSRSTITQLTLILSRSGSCLKAVTASGNSERACNNQNGICWISPSVQGLGRPKDRCLRYSNSHLLQRASALSRRSGTRHDHRFDLSEREQPRRTATQSTNPESNRARGPV
jgi:hypothetical protein